MSGILSAFIGRVAGVVTDAYFNLTTLLLPGNGTNGAQNNTFLDSSSNNFTITRNGNTTQGTFSPFSQTGWSNYFAGSSPNDLTTPDSTAFEFTGDFTIESFVYPTALGTYNAVIAHWQPGTAAGCSLVMSVNSSKRLVFAYGIGGTVASDVIGSSTTVELNTWSHVVVSRNSGTIRLFVNGTQDATTRTGATGTLNNSPNPIYIGSNTGVDYFTGYISNLRVLGGTGVTSVTVPTAPLTDITNTILLTCQSNRFIDTNTQVAAKTITVNGSGVSVQAFSPFAPTAAYDATTVGGSGYFDGSGDYLQTPSNAALGLSTGDFTVECWYYHMSRAVTNTILAPSTDNLNIYINTSGIIGFYDGTARNSTTTVPLNAWSHIALVRSGSTATLYYNGTSVVSQANTTNYATASWYIGRNSGGTDQSTGYCTSVRIVKGTAVYTGAFTPPTAPFTAITNTQLLLNYTNAGITDATAKNDLETVGNAQISTTVSKFGSGSMSFDGTGDYLLLPHTVDQMLGTGAFTIEMWIYRNASGTYGLVGKGTGTTGWLVSLNSSNQVVFTYGSSTITSTGTISATTWTYIAVVREGTGTNQTKIYISGSNDGTGTVSTDFNQTNAMYVGADRTGGSNYNGYIDDLRITKGFARTIATPSSAFALQ